MKIYRNEITKKEYFVLEVDTANGIWKNETMIYFKQVRLQKLEKVCLKDHINKEKIKQLMNIVLESILIFDKQYQKIDIVPHCTIKNPLDLKNQLLLKITKVDIQIGKQITKVFLKQ